ncbi:oxidoreductase molybdopterin binding protein [Natrinema pellirubrum DSM 15624]|uniref:Oxidoreductase molybdopterin binding protein n=1 Tax=Natrinema pellirubrum (strain DSM 15624 / CIP 106293 / JCM 10476 / NCIMB 786 / 157) TaxID=797303 RepID=L0JM03_NATP1|nr:molybdopterin-dependent oxidoreductase [Natrinema pellirubrum]AGB31858.1 sulfite oxidase-like oxidoreductase [Natrinema pellirubrum DSM 15624]ELY77795.1 oxidoreductase molybdopterin binding protein [Natrinema pellirubrum DSM 15624]
MGDLRQFDVPESVDPDEWRLSVTGAVRHPTDFGLADLTDLPLETYTHDFACAEGWVAEGLSWRGVPVARLLERVEPVDGSAYALVGGMDDGYACSISLERLSEAVLAVALDGDPLPVEHGGPARLVPTGDGADCWESVKWVRELEVRETEPTADDTAKNVALSRIE